MRKICNGCGGYIGIDCFNPAECEWIAQDQKRMNELEQSIRIHNLEKEIELLKEKLENHKDK